VVAGITAEASGPVRGGVQPVYDFFREVDVTRILTGRGPLPAVVGVEDPVGHWDAPGLHRMLRLSDGNTLRERLTNVEPPRTFAYEIEEITGPLGRLVVGMSGRWSFEPAPQAGGEGPTLAHWHYVFTPRSWLTWLPCLLIIKLLWQPYMAAVLAAATRLAESELGAGPDERRSPDPIAGTHRT